MVNEYHKKIMEISELGVIPKTLDQNGINVLAQKVQQYIDRTGNNDINHVLPFIITIVYSEAYLGAINDVLDILRRKE